MSRSILVTSSFLALTVVACGGSSTTTNLGGDAGDAGSSDAAQGVDVATMSETSSDSGCVPGSDYDATPQAGFPATHAAQPQVVSGGGPVLKTPSVYLVFTQNTALEPQITTFAQTLGAQPYWATTTSEYGVGALNYAGSKDLNDTTLAATMTGDQVDTYINGKLASGAVGTPDPNTIYTFFFPQSTTITQQGPTGGTEATCTDIGGYHTSTAVGGKNIPYAVVPLCANFGGLVGIDGTTGSASHEWIEAVTDPYPQVNNGMMAAYAQVDNNHFVWELLGGGEVGDMCAQRTDAFYKPSCFDFTVQRIWSNKAAAAGGDPCVPKAVGPYFNAAPVATDSLLSGQTQGALIAMGASKTIEVDLFSDFDTGGPWDVEAIDAVTLLEGPTATPSLAFTWDKTSGQNGDKLHLTIKVTGASAFASEIPGAHPMVILSRMGTDTINFWPLLVSED